MSKRRVFLSMLLLVATFGRLCAQTAGGDSGRDGEQTALAGLPVTPFLKTLSLKNSFSELGVQLFPNPVVDKIYVGNVEGATVKVEIFSSQGERLMDGVYNAGDALDVSFLQSGLYYIRVNGQTLRFSKV